MKKNLFYTSSSFLIAIMLFLTACDNNNDNTPPPVEITDEEVVLAEDAASADDLYASLDAMIDDQVAELDISNYSLLFGLKMGNGFHNLFDCRTVTVNSENDSTTFPKIITIDYGDEGCSVEVRGKEQTRKGKIIITLTGRRNVEGSKRTVTFDDYYANGVKIEGTREVENLGENEDGNVEFRHTLTDGKLTFDDTLSYSRNAITVHELIVDTSGTKKWHITGEKNGTNAEGISYTQSITTPHVLKKCADFMNQWVIVAGVTSITRDGKVATIDYGSGECDGVATLTKDGISKEITIKRTKRRK